MSDRTNRDVLQFQSVIVRRMPGFSTRSLELRNLNPGITVVYGPNAAGKTTLVRSFNLLLWPERFAPDRAKVTGEFTVGGSRWYVEHDSGSHRFQRNGSPAEAPMLPSPERADRYNLALHDLLRDETRNRSFAEFIVRELSGGYDLQEAAEQLGFTDRPSGVGKTTKRAETAVQNLREAQKQAKSRKREERRLRDLNRQLEEAQNAQKRLEYLNQLENWYQAREEYRAERTQLEAFPELLEQFLGNEIDRLETLQNQIDQAETTRGNAQKTIEETEQRLDELDYPYEEPVDQLVRELKADHEQLKEYESKIDQLESDRARFRAQREEAARILGTDATDEALLERDRASFDELTELARREERTRTRLEALETHRDLLLPEEESENDSASPEYETLQQGCERLEHWLVHSSGEAAVVTSPRSGPIVTASVVIAGLAVVTGAYVHPYFYGLLVVPVLLHLWVQQRTISASTPGSEEASIRGVARREYERLDLSEPRQWDRQAVRDRLEKLYELRARRRLQEIRQFEWQRRQQEYEELRAKREDLEEQRRQFAENYGFAPDDSRTLLHLVNRLSRWQEAQDEVRGRDRELEHVREKHQDLLESVNDELEQWGMESAEYASQLGPRIQDIEQRVDSFREHRRRREEAQERFRNVERKLSEWREEREAFYERLGLESGNEAKLRKLARRYDDYCDQKKRCEDAEAVLKNQEKTLTEMQMYDPSHRDWDRAELDRELEEVRSKAEDYDDLREEIARIETQVEEAKKAYTIEPARAEKERALERLEEQLHGDCEAMIGDVLRKYIETVNTDRTAPAVFERARGNLSTITAGRYRLRLNRSSDRPAFRVIDTRTGAGKGLDELSSGTRVQVLLAVRLAFVEETEDRLQLPLYLDETLANADDEKARTIIESTVELARTGRQIFYFTAQGDEVAKWQAHVPDLRTIDLTERTERSLTGSVDVPDPETISRGEDGPPSAQGVSHDEYGDALEVPPFDPREPVGSVHLWYLVEDVELLEDLLSRNLERWGPLETLLTVSDRDPIESDSGISAEQIRQLAGAAETFIDRWRQGRNRRIDRSVLVETDAVSENFLDEVAELVERCDGDPQLVLERLRDGEVSGFRRNKMDELEQFFLDNDYIDRRDLLDDPVIRAAMISSLDSSLFESPDSIVDRFLERIRDRRPE